MIDFLDFWMFYLLFIPNVYCLLLLTVHLYCICMLCGGTNQNWGPAVLDGMPNSDDSTRSREFTNYLEVVVMQGTESLLQTSEKTGCA